MSNWYEHFFHGLALEMWNALMTPEATRAESDFLEAKLGLRPGSRVTEEDSTLASSAPCRQNVSSDLGKPP